MTRTRAPTSSGIFRSCFHRSSPVTAFSACTRLTPRAVDVVNIAPLLTTGVICCSPRTPPAKIHFGELLDVAGVDLVERAVAPTVVRPAVHEPVGGVAPGVRQAIVGDVPPLGGRRGRRRQTE